MALLTAAPLGNICDSDKGRFIDGVALRRLAMKRAGSLRKAGVGPRHCVGIVHGGSANFFADLFAVWHLGATAACLDPALTRPEVQNLIRFLHPSVVLIDRSYDAASLDSPILCMEDESGTAGEDLNAEDVPGDFPALYLVTSGTAGDPKVVVLSRNALEARLVLNLHQIGRPKLARTLLTLSTAFGHGLIGNALTALFAGGDLIIPPKTPTFFAEAGRFIDEHSVTFLTSVPTFWRMVLKSERSPSKKTLQRVHVGSSPLSAALWNSIVEWSTAVTVNCYGMTETSNWAAGASSENYAPRDGLVGKAWGGEAAVLGAEGQHPSRLGQGEILFKTPSIMSGYLGNPSSTADAFYRGWFRTGDVGEIDESGTITLLGRLKDDINKAGSKIHPAEVEAILEKHPAVLEACVFSIPDDVSGEGIAAAVCLRDGKTVESHELASWCRNRIRRAAVPDTWRFVSSIPRNARGKVMRSEMRRQFNL